MKKIIFLLSLVYSGISFCYAGSRIALVIGNDKYQHVTSLDNAVADSNAISEKLKKAGFNVIYKSNASLKEMQSSVRDFTSRLSQGDEAIFYYAGHGLQIKGANYLIPVDVKNDSEAQVQDDALPLQRLIDDVEEKKVKFSLSIIDACRNNPFKKSGRSIGTRGLAAVNSANGQMIMYSASAGQEALDKLDDKDKNGVFTRIFLEEMEKDLEIHELVRQVRKRVSEIAKSVEHEQTPALYDETTGDFYFFPNVTINVIDNNQKNTSTEVEITFWNSIKDSSNAEDFQAYLKEYPSGKFVSLANNKIKDTLLKQAEDLYKHKSYTEAFSNFKELAEQDNSYAQYKLGSMYLAGIGVAQDKTQAMYWFRKAAEQGYDDAQFLLGIMYANGEGVTKDSTQATYWIRKAAEQGHAGAKEYLKKLDNNQVNTTNFSSNSAPDNPSLSDNSTRQKQAPLNTRSGYQIMGSDGGIVKDTQTGLMWMRCSVGQTWDGSTCAGEIQVMNWNSAMNQKANYAGYSDWRLPTKKELESLVYCSDGQTKSLMEQENGFICTNNEKSRVTNSPTINTTYFLSTTPALYWSSLPSPYGRSAWAVNFSGGGSYIQLDYLDNHVRLVR
jgi:hypothetical protein